MIGTYTESLLGKAAFVDEILNPIVRQAGYDHATYQHNPITNEEVVLVYPLAYRYAPTVVCVTADSCIQLLCDVIKKMGWML